MSFITIPEITALANLYTEGHSIDEIRMAIGVTLQHLRNNGSQNIDLIEELQDITMDGCDMTNLNEVADEIGQLFQIQADLGKVVAPIHLSFMATFALALIDSMAPSGFTAPGFDQALELNNLEAEALMTSVA
mgnify:CR=1 FL=1